MAVEVLPGIELETAPNPTASVVWLHGLGADGNDFVPVVRELALPPNLPIRFVFPHAPVRAVTINNGVRMRAWYDIAAADLNNRADLAGVKQSQLQVEALIAREVARGIPAARIVVAGFSQGGAVALYTGLRHAERLAGIIALSTYLIGADALAIEAASINRKRADIHGTWHRRSDRALRLGQSVPGGTGQRRLPRRLALLRHGAFGVHGGNHRGVGVAAAGAAQLNTNG